MQEDTITTGNRTVYILGVMTTDGELVHVDTAKPDGTPIFLFIP